MFPRQMYAGRLLESEEKTLDVDGPSSEGFREKPQDIETETRFDIAIIRRKL